MYRAKFTAVVAAMLSLGGTPGAAADLNGLPVALICSIPDGDSRVGYLVAIKPDGSATYFSPRNLVATVDPNGLVERTELRMEGDCAGKTIDELRASGQTIEAVG